MPKAKEFFSLLKQQGQINEPKYDELLEKMPDFDVPEEAVKAFENSFYTLDRAAVNPAVNRKIRHEVLKPIDRDFEKIIQAVASVDKETGTKLQSLIRDGADKLPDTYKRTEFLANTLGEVFNKVKTAPAGGDEELKKELQKREQTIQDALQKLQEAESQHKTVLTQKEKEFEERLHEYQLDTELQKLAGSYTLAEAFEKTRPAINKVVLSELKGSNKLRLGMKDGQNIIQVFDDKGEPRYNGNSPITINHLLEEKYKPFLKQSSAEPEPKTNPKTTFTSSGNTNPTLRRGVSTQVKSKS